MSTVLYKLLMRSSRRLGLWPLRLIAMLVATVYFVCFHRRRAHSLRFYRALFPERSRCSALVLTWRQYQDFARVFSERLQAEHAVVFEREGDGYLAQARAQGRGVVLLMSHFGRWEIGARQLAREHGTLTLIMGGQDGGKARAGIDGDLRAAGLDVLTVAEGAGPSFDIFAALAVLRRGGMVSLAADRTFRDARVLRVPFCGQWVGVAAAPFALALVSGAPLLTVFCAKSGPRRYRFMCQAPIALAAATPAERRSAMQAAALVYLERLRTMVEAHPEQWQIFEGFFLEGGGASLPAAVEGDAAQGGA